MVPQCRTSTIPRPCSETKLSLNERTRNKVIANSSRFAKPSTLMMNWKSLVRTVLFATLFPTILANSRHENRSDSKWKHNHQTAADLSVPTSGNHSFAILQRALGEPEVFDERKVPDSEVTCEEARLKCAYRVGCGMALQSYMVGCSDVITGSSQRCSDHCRNALIALTSTEEGEGLMKCKCGDTFCEDAKQRITVCRNAVLSATNTSSPVSCGVAQWICLADPLCSTALEYYNRFCRSMFAGKKCTSRCKNSISILRRQEKAAKLTSCVCDGTEDYDCPSILDNMNKLCRLKPYVSSTTTTTSPKTTTTERSQQLITTKPYHRQEIAVGGGSGVAGRQENATKKNEPDQVGDVTQPAGQLPRHPSTNTMPEICGQTNARNCSQSANEESNEATVDLHPPSTSDRSSGAGTLIQFPLITSCLIVLILSNRPESTF